MPKLKRKGRYPFPDAILTEIVRLAKVNRPKDIEITIKVDKV